MRRKALQKRSGVLGERKSNVQISFYKSKLNRMKHENQSESHLFSRPNRGVIFSCEAEETSPLYRYLDRSRWIRPQFNGGKNSAEKTICFKKKKKKKKKLVLKRPKIRDKRKEKSGITNEIRQEKKEKKNIAIRHLQLFVVFLCAVSCPT